jgi:hypothetical protein
LVLAAETATVNGNPVASHNTWIFEPGLPRSTGLGAVRPPRFRPYRRRVHHPRPVD